MDYTIITLEKDVTLTEEQVAFDCKNRKVALALDAISKEYYVTKLDYVFGNFKSKKEALLCFDFMVSDSQMQY